MRELDSRIECGTGLGNRCVNWIVESSAALAWGGVRELDGQIGCGTGLGNRCVNWMVESSVALAWATGA